MSITNKLRRFDLIITKIENSKYPSLQSISDYLNKYDFDVVSRTLQRDIDELRTEFRILIEYDRKYKGYYIEKDNTTESVIQFIKNMSLQANLLDFMKENQTSNNIVLKEKYALKGVEYIPKLLLAIQHFLQIEFLYQAFDSEKPKKYILQSYALKEFLGRWYIVGVAVGKSTILKFGVDRLTSLHVLEKKFKPDKSIDLETYFSRMIGIIDNGEDRAHVVLSFSPFQANYIRTLPLHWSQNEILTTDNEVRFEYFILTNYELLQKILSYGAEVKVIQPASLKKEHKQVLKAALARYK
jgi:predicted DNA-binding transcriptional regulator YafY